MGGTVGQFNVPGARQQRVGIYGDVGSLVCDGEPAEYMLACSVESSFNVPGACQHDMSISSDACDGVPVVCGIGGTVSYFDVPGACQQRVGNCGDSGPPVCD